MHNRRSRAKNVNLFSIVFNIKPILSNCSFWFVVSYFLKPLLSTRSSVLITASVKVLYTWINATSIININPKTPLKNSCEATRDINQQIRKGLGLERGSFHTLSSLHAGSSAVGLGRARERKSLQWSLYNLRSAPCFA